MSSVQTQSRRERLRAEATQEIKSIALRLMAENGPGAIALRAIAREMGMTAGAIYGYYPTRDDLITALVRELYTALVETLESAVLAVPPDGDPAARIMAWAAALRDWAVANPQGFQLIYGAPVPGYQPPPDGPAAEAERRMCTGLSAVLAPAWPHVREHLDQEYAWADFDPRLVEHVRAASPDLEPTFVGFVLRTWAHVHGLVSLEIHGHLGRQVRDPAKLYHSNLQDLVRFLGLTPGRVTSHSRVIRSLAG
jgi:AcrR family transcriptional regulator